MISASTPDGRGQDRPNDAEPFFPSEGTFNPVVPLSEIGHAPATLRPVNASEVSKPAEADWARAAERAKRKEEEETLVPARATSPHAARRSWVTMAAVIALSVTAGLASGSYLIWSAQRAPAAQTSAPAAAEAQPLPPALAAQESEANTKVERAHEAVRDEKPSEVAKAEKSNEVAPAPRQAPPLRTEPAPRAARPVEEAVERTPVPKPARVQPPTTARTRTTTAEREPPVPAAPARTLPVSSPPPSARSKKVIQWP